MREFKATLLIGLLATVALGADNSLGTWKLNIGKSTYSPAPLPYKSLTMTRVAVQGAVKTTVTAERSDGSRMSVIYTAKYDGRAAPMPGTGSPVDTISMRQVDANTFTTERRKPGGKYFTAGRFVIAGDGKTMVNTVTGTDADGKPLKAVIVYDRR